MSGVSAIKAAAEGRASAAEQRAAEAQAKLVELKSQVAALSSLVETAVNGFEATSTTELIGQVSAARLDARYDLLIVGGGPTGVAAALEAALLGHHVLVIDKPKAQPTATGLDVSFGGPTGLFSKAMRDAGKQVDVQSLKSMGLDADVIWQQVRNKCVRLASMNAEHQVELLKEFKVDYLQAHATVISANSALATISSNEHHIIATKYVLIATGSKPLRPKEIPFDDQRVFDSDTVNSLTFMPSSVVILGSGIIAIEYAKIFRKLGVPVTMLVRSTAASALLRIGLDRDICAKLLDVLQQDNVCIYENTSVSHYQVEAVGNAPVKVYLKSSEEGVPSVIECSLFLGAIGRRANTAGFGLEKLGIAIAKGGHIEVDKQFQSSVPGIYAAGDVIGPPSLVSTGVYQGQGAVRAMFSSVDHDWHASFPVGIWTVPEIGYYGMTKEAAEAKGMEVEEGLAPYSACLRGRVFAPEGLLKLVFLKKDGVILGVHAIGADACELVHYGMDLVDQSITIFTVMFTIFTAVTFHELFQEAATNGNKKLTFGVMWLKIISELTEGLKSLGSKPDKAQLQLEFKKMDTNNSDSLDVDELSAVLKAVRIPIKRGTIGSLIRLIDADGSGQIEWSEFANVCRAAGFKIGDDASTEQSTQIRRAVADSGVPQLIGQVPVAQLDLPYDLVVIGGGPTGVAAALKASSLGNRVLLVDKPKLPPKASGLDVSFGGPTGLYSKAMRDAGKQVDVQSLRSMGLGDDVVWLQVRNMCERLASMNANHQVEMLSDFKVDYIQADAVVVSATAISLNSNSLTSVQTVSTDKVLLATGSKPVLMKEIPFDGQRVLDSDTVNSLSFLPSSVAILGAGIISIEFAKIFRKLGAKVLMLVRGSVSSSLERIGMDRDIAAKLLEVLRNDDVTIYENTSIASYEVPPTLDMPLRLQLKGESAPEFLECSIFLAATGRKANMGGIDTAKLGITASKAGHIEVDSSFQTSAVGIYAAGDVIGPPMLASTGVYQAQHAVLSMFGEAQRDAHISYPIGMWTTPECGYYGMTKESAEKAGLVVEEGIAAYSCCLRGRVFAPEGLMKLVFEKSGGVILGVHIVGENACELVHYGMDLVDQRVTIFSVMSTLFVAVTFHELFKEAAVNGNSKLKFGWQWHTILNALKVARQKLTSRIDERSLQLEFASVDTSSPGTLDAQGLTSLFRNMGLVLERDIIDDLIFLADEDGTYSVSINKLIEIFAESASERSSGDPPFTPRSRIP